MTKKSDLLGQRFGRWKVIAPATSANVVRWLCRCDCGAEKSVTATSLVGGGSTSCGCYRKERPSTRRTHGMSESSEYHIWRTMKNRCGNPKIPLYSGVKICKQWLDSFESFYADMGPRPSSGHSIDRYPDKEGDYDPGNCRWATRREQQRNLRRNICVVYDGKRMTLPEAAEASGIKYDVLKQRFYKGRDLFAKVKGTSGSLPPDNPQI